MQPYSNNQPIGPMEYVSESEVASTAKRMFGRGADEVRIRKLGGAGYTKPLQNKPKQRDKNKAARMARRRNRQR